VAKNVQWLVAMPVLDGKPGIKNRSLKAPYVQDSVVMFNSTNDICLMYTPLLMADRSTEVSQWTSSALKHTVFYFEGPAAASTPSSAPGRSGGRFVRYELSRDSASSSVSPYDRYRWSKVVSDSSASLVQGSAYAEMKGLDRKRSAVPLSGVGVDYHERIDLRCC